MMNKSRGPAGAGEMPKNLKKSLGQLASYCKSYFPAIIVAVLLAITASVFSLIGPNKLQDITDLIKDGLVTGIDIKAVEDIAFFLVVLYALGFIFNYIQGFIMATVTQNVSKSLRPKYQIKSTAFRLTITIKQV